MTQLFVQSGQQKSSHFLVVNTFHELG